MNILLVGYGKMGKTIEAIALEKGHEIVDRIDRHNLSDLSRYNGSNVEVAIEFSLVSWLI